MWLPVPYHHKGEAVAAWRRAAPTVGSVIYVRPFGLVRGRRAQGTTVTGHLPAFTSRTASEPISR
jgi:hypothetical protein